MKPLRIPLHSKRSKRCPACTHILIKPEQKAQSVRYKIKLVAANYLPAITIALPHLNKPTVTSDAAKRALMKISPQLVDDGTTPRGLVAGKTYPFHLALTNPLYDPIQVRLSVQRVHVTATTANGGAPSEKARRPPFAISLPTSHFPIAAFAEAWEYEDDEDMMVDDEEFGTGVRSRDKDGRGKAKTVGVLEKRANVTLIGGEVVIGKEARGNVKVSLLDNNLFCSELKHTALMQFNMLVTYTYRSDDPTPSEGDGDAPKNSKPPEVKTFAFYTVVDLGAIIPREETRPEPDG